jgi:hypothetical protein
MYNGLKYFLTFTVGAAAGAVVSWVILKPKFEKQAQDEIDSFKEYWAGKTPKTTNPELEDDDSNTTKEEYESMVEEAGYIKTEGNPNPNYIEVIPPEEFDTLDDYSIVSMKYYNDQVLTTDVVDKDMKSVQKVIVTDPEDIIGPDALTRFGEYEDDSVFVRNHKTKTDYEILLDMDNYWDKQKRDSNRAEE